MSQTPPHVIPTYPRVLAAARAGAIDVLMQHALGAPAEPQTASRRRRAPPVDLDEAIECLEHDGSAPGVAGLSASGGASVGELPLDAIADLDGSYGSSLFELIIDDE